MSSEPGLLKPIFPRAGGGRPRAFDLDRAVEAGVALFKRRGFEATSLDALTEAMGISRSSFYAAFGSKHGVLLAALRRYSTERLARLEAMASSPGGDTAMRVVAAISAPDGPHGCLLVNCVTELCPADPDVATLGTHHLDRIQAILATSLSPETRDNAPALLALALGALTLRKAGRPAAEVDGLLTRAAARLTCLPEPRDATA